MEIEILGAEEEEQDKTNKFRMLDGVGGRVNDTHKMLFRSSTSLGRA